MTVVLTAAVLRAAARAPGAATFPFLAPFGKTPKPGCCGRAAAAPDIRSVGVTLERLPPDRLTAFKAMIGASTLTVWVVRAAKLTKLEL